MNDADLYTIAANDQLDTEPDRLAARIGTFYKRLLADDVPQAQAAKMAREYNGYVLERHFGHVDAVLHIDMGEME